MAGRVWTIAGRPNPPSRARIRSGSRRAQQRSAPAGICVASGRVVLTGCPAARASAGSARARRRRGHSVPRRANRSGRRSRALTSGWCRARRPRRPPRRRRRDRRPRSAAHHQRAEGRGARVRARQEGLGDRAGLRPSTSMASTAGCATRSATPCGSRSRRPSRSRSRMRRARERGVSGSGRRAGPPGGRVARREALQERLVHRVQRIRWRVGRRVRIGQGHRGFHPVRCRPRRRPPNHGLRPALGVVLQRG